MTDSRRAIVLTVGHARRHGNTRTKCTHIHIDEFIHICMLLAYTRASERTGERTQINK